MPVVVPSARYISVGNQSIVIDELKQEWVEESEKPQFAAENLNPSFRFGGDEMVFIQKPDVDIIRKIGSAHEDYWDRPEQVEALISAENEVDGVFRAFEADGNELLMSPEAIISAATYLHGKTDKMQFEFLTEVPAKRPRVTKVTRKWDHRISVDMGSTIEMPSDCYDKRAQKEPIGEDKHIYVIRPLKVPFVGKEIRLTCFMVYLGDPQLIIFCGDKQPLNYVPGDLVEGLVRDFYKEGLEDQDDVEIRNRFFQLVGNHLNRRNRPQFPRGIDVNFVMIGPEEELYLRTFRRGVKREVKTSGTGAAASALAAYKMNLLKSVDIKVISQGSTFEYQVGEQTQSEPQGYLTVHLGRQGISLEGPCRRIGASDIGE